MKLEEYTSAAAVIGLQNEDWGEAVIVLKSERDTQECRRQGVENRIAKTLLERFYAHRELRA